MRLNRERSESVRVATLTARASLHGETDMQTESRLLKTPPLEVMCRQQRTFPKEGAT